MTTISISLTAGDNYISFPATSTDNFGMILQNIDSNIDHDSNGNKLFFKYDPITTPYSIDYWTTVKDYDFIEQGRGYLLKMNSPANLEYDGIEYNLTFDQLKSRLMTGVTGWNLVGTGKNIITQPNWCKLIDPMTGFPVTQILPKNSYWVNYNDCQIYPLDPLIIIFGLGLGISILSLYISLKKPGISAPTD